MQILALAMAARGLRRAYPERDMRWLHRVAHRRADIGSQRVEVGLVAQARDKPLDLCCGIALPAVDAPVNRRLQAVA